MQFSGFRVTHWPSPHISHPSALLRGAKKIAQIFQFKNYSFRKSIFQGRKSPEHVPLHHLVHEPFPLKIPWAFWSVCSSFEDTVEGLLRRAPSHGTCHAFYSNPNSSPVTLPVTRSRFKISAKILDLVSWKHASSGRRLWGKEGLLFSPRDMCGCEVHWCEPVSQHENEAAYMILRSSFCSMWDNDTKGGILWTDRYPSIQYSTCRMISWYMSFKCPKYWQILEGTGWTEDLSVLLRIPKSRQRKWNTKTKQIPTVTPEFQLQEIPNGLNRSPVILSEWNF